MPDQVIVPGDEPTRHRGMDGSNFAKHGGGVAVSIALHALLLGAWLSAAMHLPLAPKSASVAVMFEAPAALASAADLSSATLAPQSSTEALEITHRLPSLVVTAPAMAARPGPTSARPKPAAPPRTLSSAPPSASPAVAPPAKPLPSEGDIAGLKLRIREAVRTATLYPAVARQMHREGRAQVMFEYVDGAAQKVSLACSSQSGLLDEAALSAVRRAAYPRPLPGMEGVRLSLMVWVNFELNQEE